MDKLKERDDWIIQQTGLCLVLLNVPMMMPAIQDWLAYIRVAAQMGIRGYCA